LALTVTAPVPGKPFPSESVPPASVQSVIPSLSESKSKKLGRGSPSKLTLPGYESALPSLLASGPVTNLGVPLAAGSNGSWKPFPLSEKLSTFPSPFASGIFASIISAIPSLSESKSKKLGTPSPSASNCVVVPKPPAGKLVAKPAFGPVVAIVPSIIPSPF